VTYLWKIFALKIYSSGASDVYLVTCNVLFLKSTVLRPSCKAAGIVKDYFWKRFYEDGL
jgi:hypothetical protein